MKNLPLTDLPQEFEAVTAWQVSYLTSIAVKITVKNGKVVKCTQLVDAPDMSGRCSQVGTDVLEIILSNTKGKEYK
jgi:hypothetical protein